ncbi:sorbosone dehydrogenase family protein [Actinoplanes sp. N902-109]|uniref:PQQ-dependent sugar dehydrogenase n=1 Tax=Actinoplanes sp. (strain N902-109) TaxID=649831 RepID=UPI0003295287|nr:PQQ-dependent sugar dehydrogenase [Actinoplanes sp. N902-109]AGL16646.1 hypothetical protein L083_3136 [Actinoplanes sp. N902-109]
MRASRRLAALVAMIGILGVPGTARAATAGAGAADPTIRTVTAYLTIPWGIGLLPDGSAVITERHTGRILLLRDGVTTEIQRIPLPSLDPEGGVQYEGGLLGLAVSPHYRFDRTIFIYYSTATDNRVAKLRLGGTPKPIVTGIPHAPQHDGGRLQFGPDGYLYVATGFGPDNDNSQNLSSLGGKILRITPDGKPAPGNPFGTLVYSYGHRNVEGMAWDSHGRMYASEMGDAAADELNRIYPGRNYGWPVCEGTCDDPRYVNPLLTWETSDASPSGLAFYHGNLYMAALHGQRLWQIPVRRDGGVEAPTALLAGTYGRLRTVLTGPDGSLWVSTSNHDLPFAHPAPDDDKILSITFR